MGTKNRASLSGDIKAALVLDVASLKGIRKNVRRLSGPVTFWTTRACYVLIGKDNPWHISSRERTIMNLVDGMNTLSLFYLSMYIFFEHSWEWLNAVSLVQACPICSTFNLWNWSAAVIFDRFRFHFSNHVEIRLHFWCFAWIAIYFLKLYRIYHIPKGAYPQKSFVYAIVWLHGTDVIRLICRYSTA